MKSVYYLLCLTCLLLSSLVSQAREIDPADTPKASEAGWWKQRHTALTKNLKENNCDLLFIGDSITQGWEGAGKEVWNQVFVPLNAANFGISGDRTEHVLWRMNDSKLETPRPPKVCVIHIGTNNTGHYKAQQPAEETAKAIAAIAKKLTDKFSKTDVIILQIFPRGKNSDDPLRIHNEKINSLLAKLKMPRVTTVNINNAFLNSDSTFKEGLSGDLLHLTPQGYQVWADALTPYLKKYFPALSSKTEEEK